MSWETPVPYLFGLIEQIVASVVVEMEVYVDKFIHNSPENVQVTPVLGTIHVHVNLYYDLVDVVQVFSWEILKGIVFSSLHIHLQNYVLLYQISAGKDVHKIMKRNLFID